MTLNKQRILSELGSVVNQLQSADCGCMGKLFGTTPQMNCMNNSFPQQGGHGYGCHAAPCHGCHQHSPCCAESYSMNSAPQSPYTCMGQCNAPKLYADTYSYLNKNLMQPVVKEVYNDLSSLGPTNTIMNNELGSKMGIMQQGLVHGHDPALNEANAHHMNAFNPHTSQMQPVGANTQMMQNTPPSAIAPNQQYFGGMGPQIVNMINGESVSKPVQPQQGLTGPMIIDAPQSPHGIVGVTPLTAPANSYARHNDKMRNNINPQQIYAANTSNSLSNTIKQTPLDQPSYGQHTQGMTKFNEIFPGVMQGLGGDLGFDPMAIAIQMNPANQQQVAMNTMQKMMNNNQNISKILEPSVTSEAHPNTIKNTGQILPTHQNTVIPSPNTNLQKPISNNNQSNANQQQSNTPIQNQHYIYNTPQQAQEMVDPSTVGQNLSTIPEDPSIRTNILPPQRQTPQNNQQSVVQPIIKEPIFPVDTTKQKIYHNLNVKKSSEPAYFNTLGQPVEKLPANMYRPVMPSLPQTLSPQPMNVNSKYSKVKPTVSKTALMGEKPTEKTPSRSQLQQIYKQFKGSQSYTKQNVSESPVDAPTHSERHLNMKQDTRMHNIIPVERFGGDSAISGQLNHIEPVRYDHIGDVPVQNKPNPIKPEKEYAGNNLKGRNGLQDMVYTSYPTSAAWTFHGDGKTEAYPSHRGRRFHRY
ncbi:unnamed protein product [Pieris macdunnoughi]|uniref:Uncharacterized protein n=1 Tax=Pieris macdunnoughi TaxID=345717 RepID=A0A821TTS5_9NEOP|nr:unnamed protein product [Pieris macdunnoughi]